MTDLDNFAAAVAARPDDDTARLAFADFLDERGDPRACDHRLAVLLRSIKAAPADDAPRLEYADVADRYGRRERAEFIRVQCAADALHREGHGGDCPHLRRKREAWRGIGAQANPTCDGCVDLQGYEYRERELLDAIGYHIVNTPRVWPVSMTLGRASTTPGDDDARLGIRRGFVAWWRLTAADWVANGDAILAEHPVERVVWSVPFAADADRREMIRLARERGVANDPESGKSWADVAAGIWTGVAFEFAQVVEPDADGIDEAVEMTPAGWERTRRLLAAAATPSPRG